MGGLATECQGGRRTLIRRERHLRTVGAFREGCTSCDFVYKVSRTKENPLTKPMMTNTIVLPGSYRVLCLGSSGGLSTTGERRLCSRVVRGTITTTMNVTDPTEVSRVGVLRTACRTVHRTVSGLTMRPKVLLGSTIAVPRVVVPRIPVVGKSTGDISVTTTDVLTGIAESQLVMRCSGIVPRCKFTNRGKCKSGRRVRTVGGCKPAPVREGAFVGGFVW